MIRKYLLTSGKTTTKIEEYIIDLFNLYLTIYPGDIPHRKDIGVDFNLSGVFKNDLLESLNSKVSDLINKIKATIPSNIQINQDSLELIDEETAKLVISVNSIKSSDIIIDLWKH